MPRSTAAYLADVVDACDSISEVLEGVDLETYRARRPIRSAVEREFVIIGEAVSALTRQAPEVAAGISHARLIVGFRNQVVHEYATIDDEAVYAIARHDVSVLRDECAALLGQIAGED
jgi:uncharacterized protein with HEPN domain